MSQSDSYSGGKQWALDEDKRLSQGEPRCWEAPKPIETLHRAVQGEPTSEIRCAVQVAERQAPWVLQQLL